MAVHTRPDTGETHRGARASSAAACSAFVQPSVQRVPRGLPAQMRRCGNPRVTGTANALPFAMRANHLTADSRLKSSDQGSTGGRVAECLTDAEYQRGDGEGERDALDEGAAAPTDKQRPKHATSSQKEPAHVRVSCDESVPVQKPVCQRATHLSATSACPSR
jgi:hypothetical protein